MLSFIFETIELWVLSNREERLSGNISKLAVIDVDDPNLLPELEELLPELNGTTRVRTRRGYHYYFSLNNIQGTA